MHTHKIKKTKQPRRTKEFILQNKSKILTFFFFCIFFNLVIFCALFVYISTFAPVNQYCFIFACKNLASLFHCLSHQLKQQHLAIALSTAVVYLPFKTCRPSRFRHKQSSCIFKQNKKLMFASNIECLRPASHFWKITPLIITQHIRIVLMQAETYADFSIKRAFTKTKHSCSRVITMQYRCAGQQKSSTTPLVAKHLVKLSENQCSEWTYEY